MPEIFTSKPVNQPKSAKEAVSPPTVKPSPTREAPLTAFMERPRDIHFETQEPEEEILLLMRRHPVTNVGWVTTMLILIALPLIIGPLLLSSALIPPEIPAGYYLVVPFLWYLGVAGIAFTNFLRWYFNVYIVTNDRVVDIDWLSLLYKQLSSTQLEKIQDVTYNQGGILDSFFDFGNVLIQTAGNEPNFEFEAVPKPERVVRQIHKVLEHGSPTITSV